MSRLHGRTRTESTYAEERQGGSGQEEGKRRRRKTGRGWEREDPLALAGCSPVGIRCISWLHLVDENIMPIACAAPGVYCVSTRNLFGREQPRAGLPLAIPFCIREIRKTEIRDSCYERIRGRIARK